MTRGAFIVVEGLDRSGKSTQTAALHDRLVSEGKSVKLYKFPDRTTATGKMIDSYLRSQSDLDDRAIHLLFSANRWEAAETLIAELEAGTTIIADRYAFSGVAFSAAKSSAPSSSTIAPKSTSSSILSYEWCRAPDTSLPAPDLVLFLDISEDAQKARGGYGEERYEKVEVQRRVREVFRRIASEFTTQPSSGEKESPQTNGVKWVEIDAGRTLEDVASAMWAAVEPFVAGTDEPIGRLWEGTLGR